MSVTISERAVELVRKSLEIGNYDPATVMVRLRMAGGALRPTFVREALPTDVTFDFDGVTIFVDPGVEGTIDVTPEHETLTLL